MQTCVCELQPTRLFSRCLITAWVLFINTINTQPGPRDHFAIKRKPSVLWLSFAGSPAWPEDRYSDSTCLPSLSLPFPPRHPPRPAAAPGAAANVNPKPPGPLPQHPGCKRTSCPELHAAPRACVWLERARQGFRGSSVAAAGAESQRHRIQVQLPGLGFPIRKREMTTVTTAGVSREYLM